MNSVTKAVLGILILIVIGISFIILVLTSLGIFIITPPTSGSSITVLVEKEDSLGNTIQCGTFMEWNKTDHKNGIFIESFNPSGLVNWNVNISGLNMYSFAGMEIDSFSNIFVTGYTNSPDFPVTNGSTKPSNNNVDIFLLKINSAGELLWTYIYPGNNRDLVNGIEIDEENFVYLYGVTSSTDFLNTFFYGIGENSYSFEMSKGFVMKISTSGSTMWTIIHSDSSMNEINDLKIDMDKKLVVLGHSTFITSETQIKTRIFVSKFALNGSLIWTNYYQEDIETEQCCNLEIDSENNILVGGTYIIDYDFTDIFVLKFSKDGIFLWDAVIGGDKADWMWDIKVFENNTISIIIKSHSDIIKIKNQSTKNIAYQGDFNIYQISLSSDGETILQVNNCPTCIP